MAKPSWITIVPTSGSGDSSFTVKAEEHTGRKSRSGTVSVQGKGLTAKTFSVSQSAKSEFIKFTSASYSTTKVGGTLRIGGTSNSPFLNIDWVTGRTDAGIDPVVFDEQVEMDFTEGNSSQEQYQGEYPSQISLDGETFRVGSSSPSRCYGITTQNATQFGFPSTLGEEAQYDFYFDVYITKNTASIGQRIGIQATGSSSNVFDSTIITIAAGSAFLEIYSDATHKTALTTLSFKAQGEEKTAYIDSNVSWTIS